MHLIFESIAHFKMQIEPFCDMVHLVYQERMRAMVNIYNDIKHEIVERLAYDLFEDFGVTAEKINPGNMIDVMLLLEDKVKVDVEKNESFTEEGVITVDFVASCEPRSVENSEAAEEDDLFERFAQKQNIRVTEKGKHFQKGNFDYLMVFFYDHFINTKEYNRYDKPGDQINILPDYTLLIKSDELVKHIHENSDYYFDRIELQRKTNNPLINKVDSSAFSVPVDKLRAETDCLFYNQLDVNQEEIMRYLDL